MPRILKIQLAITDIGGDIKLVICGVYPEETKEFPTKIIGKPIATNIVSVFEGANMQLPVFGGLQNLKDIERLG